VKKKKQNRKFKIQKNQKIVIVQLNWIGNKVPSKQKLRIAEFKQEIAKIFVGCSVSLDVVDHKDVAAEAITKKISDKKGTIYDFGNNEVVKAD